MMAREGGKGTSGDWATGATKDTSAGSGSWESSGGDLLKRQGMMGGPKGGKGKMGGKGTSGDWATGATKDTSAGSGSWDSSKGDLL
ncbi:hypothetical protein E3P86_02962 [Wallemia ichthyophaga]|uniref:Uncharacterized protein n=1 Tax=Wallemia ichthyophaga TaxID=245174 RepID=A0A4T0IU95_WALIC|nr:hypothetical protein E3P86_02962 [Wallemia ichthyophaga]